MPEATRSDRYQLADIKVGGKLDEILAEMRAAGTSGQDAVRRLHVEHDIKVSVPTALKWMKEAS